MNAQPRDDATAWTRAGGIGRLGALSINTWIIIFNIAIFVLTRVVVLLPQTQVTLGKFLYDGVTPVQAARAQVDRSSFRSGVKDHPELFYHPILDPATPQTDQFGRAVLDQATRRPMPKEIGAEYFQVMPVLEAWGHFSTKKAFFDIEVWRFVTFQFLHANVTHIVFNMLGLWFVGGLVEQYLGRKRYAAFYLASGIFGAVMYLALNFIGYILRDVVHIPSGFAVPGVLFNEVWTPLIGASAGVFGVLMAAAFIAPNEPVAVAYIIPMKLRTAVYSFALLALVNLLTGGNNAGGDAAHIGGALAGYYFIRHTHLLRDFFDVFGAPGADGPPKKPLFEPHPPPDPGEIDRILAKVSDRGRASLTAEEKRTIRRAREAM